MIGSIFSLSLEEKNHSDANKRDSFSLVDYAECRTSLTPVFEVVVNLKITDLPAMSYSFTKRCTSNLNYLIIKTRKSRPRKTKPTFSGERREEIKHNYTSKLHARYRQNYILHVFRKITIYYGKDWINSGNNGISFYTFD